MTLRPLTRFIAPSPTCAPSSPKSNSTLSLRQKTNCSRPEHSTRNQHLHVTGDKRMFVVKETLKLRNAKQKAREERPDVIMDSLGGYRVEGSGGNYYNVSGVPVRSG